MEFPCEGNRVRRCGEPQSAPLRPGGQGRVFGGSAAVHVLRLVEGCRAADDARAELGELGPRGRTLSFG